MRVRPLLAGLMMLSLASCANLISFNNSYRRVQAGEVTAIKAYDRGHDCYGSFSPLVTIPKYPLRVFGCGWYDDYLVRYAAITCAVDQSSFNELKRRHFSKPARQKELTAELGRLLASPSLTPEAKARIQAELVSSGNTAAPQAAAPVTKPAPAPAAPAARQTPTPQKKAAPKPAKAPAASPRKQAGTKKKPAPRKTKPAPAPRKEKGYWDSLPSWKKI